jgi:hypothetical protein
LDRDWKFELDGTAPLVNCSQSTFPVDLSSRQCFGLKQSPYAVSAEVCREVCCGEPGCTVWQWCPAGADCGSAPAASCWTGPADISKCAAKGTAAWQSAGRTAAPTPAPAPSGDCVFPECQVATDDSHWRTVTVPHDFVVEGNFSQSADQSHGYLPYGVGWYRKHFTPPAALASAATVYIDFDGIQTQSQVWLNGKPLGRYDYGYTGLRLFLNSSSVKFGVLNSSSYTGLRLFLNSLIVNEEQQRYYLMRNTQSLIVTPLQRSK